MIVGSVTDGYNYFEAKYKRTRAFLEEMQGSGINLIITTKSNLVTRDIDLIKTYPNPLVAWSINTLDEEFKKDMDSAPTIKSRIEAMKQVHDAGIRTTCFISPIFPGITDVFTIIEKIKDKRNIDNGQPYMIITKEDRLLKMIHIDYERKKTILSSYNNIANPDGKRKYPDMEIDIDNDVIHLYKVVGKLARTQM